MGHAVARFVILVNTDGMVENILTRRQRKAQGLLLNSYSANQPESSHRPVDITEVTPRCEYDFLMKADPICKINRALHLLSTRDLLILAEQGAPARGTMIPTPVPALSRNSAELDRYTDEERLTAVYIAWLQATFRGKYSVHCLFPWLSLNLHRNAVTHPSSASAALP
jgi:hypothetical protein